MPRPNSTPKQPIVLPSSPSGDYVRHAHARYHTPHQLLVWAFVESAIELTAAISKLITNYAMPTVAEFAERVFTGGDDMEINDKYGAWSILYAGEKSVLRYDNFNNPQWVIGASITLEDLLNMTQLAKRAENVDIGDDLLVKGICWNREVRWLVCENLRRFANKPPSIV